MRRFGRRIGLSERHDALSDINPKWGDARGSRLIVQQTVVTSLHEAFLPAPHAGFRFAGPAHDLICTDAVGTQQDDLSPPDVLMRRITIPRERSQAAAVSLRAIEIPVRIRQTRTLRARRESLLGFKCQG
jgi:hypothetical protein